MCTLLPHSPNSTSAVSRVKLVKLVVILHGDKSNKVKPNTSSEEKGSNIFPWAVRYVEWFYFLCMEH